MASTSGKSKSTSGRPLRGQAREIVYNVVTHLKKQKEEYKLKYNVVESASELTGVSKSLVKTIIGEGKTSKCKGRLCFSTPTGKHREHKKKIEVDDFTRAAIRRKIHEFYVVKRIVPTLRKVNECLKDDGLLDCGKEYLRTLLHSLGFKWKKCQSKRKLLIEKPDIIALRGRYLYEMRAYRREKRNIVYVDETYIHQTQNVTACWQSESEIGVTESIGKGPRLIIVHAGGENGFVNDGLLIFKSKQKTGDYHDDMNYENFYTWVTRKLLPNLPPNSVIVLDNASYHNVQFNKKPTMASLKQECRDWLTRNNIPFTDEMTKASLLLLANSSAVKKTFKIDNLIINAGHNILRLPPYHPDLNPIELVWGDIKAESRQILSSSIDEKKKVCETLFAKYTVEKWAKCCAHVKQIEEEYFKNDALIDERMDEIIIRLGSDSESESSEEETDTDNGSQFED